MLKTVHTGQKSQTSFPSFVVPQVLQSPLSLVCMCKQICAELRLRKVSGEPGVARAWRGQSPAQLEPAETGDTGWLQPPSPLGGKQKFHFGAFHPVLQRCVALPSSP